MRTFPIFLLGLILFFACQENEPENEASPGIEITSSSQWGKNAGLTNVESIIYDSLNQVFYTTNGLAYKAGTDGFISKFSEEGALLELNWISRLNRPTGMAIQDSFLFVADVNTLLKIHAFSGKIIDQYPEPVPNSGLNDVSINQNGDVFVSASFIHSVYKLNDGNLEEWVRDEEKLAWANGLWAENNHILVAGLNLNSIDLRTTEITPITLRPAIKDFDGITADGNGGYFLTTVENSGLFHIDGEGDLDTLMIDEDYFGDLSFFQNKLFIPRGNHKEKDYFISVEALTN